jgi:hypothetical protein
MGLVAAAAAAAVPPGGPLYVWGWGAEGMAAWPRRPLVGRACTTLAAGPDGRAVARLTRTPAPPPPPGLAPWRTAAPLAPPPGLALPAAPWAPTPACLRAAGWMS